MLSPVGALSLLVTAVTPLMAWGSTIVGLRDGEGIHILEYVIGGEPWFCINNARATDVRLLLVDYWTEPCCEDRGVRIAGGRGVTGDTLAILDLAAGDFADIPAIKVPDAHLIEVLADGVRVGLISGHTTPQVEGQQPVVMLADLDCPGAYGCGLWTEQLALRVSSGQEFSVDLALDKGWGVVLIERSPLRVPVTSFIAPEDVTSSSLVVVRSSDEFAISAQSVAVAEGTHRARLQFRAPTVQRPTLFAYGGFHWTEYGIAGGRVMRGVIVEPQEPHPLPPN